MVTAARMLARAIAFPFRFGIIRRLGVIVALTAGLGAGVVLVIARWTDMGGGAFTSLFVVSYVLTIGAVMGAAYAFRRIGTRRARTLEDLLVLTPAQFEDAIACMLRDRGYRDVSVVGGPGDLAADILCRDRKGQSIAVQCKRKAPGQRVGSAEMQLFIGMISVHHGADQGIYVTTSSFTRPAVELAEAHRITLIDGEVLVSMIRRTPRGRSKAVRRAA